MLQIRTDLSRPHDMSQPDPPWFQRLPSSPSNSSRRTVALPPGAMEPAVPGYSAGPSSPTQQYSTVNGFPYGDSLKGQRMPSGGGLGEFGVPSQPQQAYSSSSRRPLPTQPSTSPIPTTQSSSSIGTSRRALPTPPGMTPATSSMAFAEPPKPSPRPTRETALPPAPFRRNLPALPPSVLSQGRIPSNSDTTPRPLPNPAPPAPNPVLPSSRDGFVPPSSLVRQASDCFYTPRGNFYESPVSFTGSFSTPGYFGDAGPSRSKSESYSLSHSASISSDYSRTTISAPTDETGPTSLVTSSIGHGGWQPKLERYVEVEGEGSNVTVRPPSTGPLGSPSTIGHASDGRVTPRPEDRRASPPRIARLPSESRHRPQNSASSSIGYMDLGLPATPRVMPSRSLQQQRSFLDTPPNSSGPSSGNLDPGQPSMSRHSSSASRDTNYTTNNSSRQQTPFPEPHPNVGRRRSSNPSSLHPSTISGRPPSELSPSWAQQSQPPAHWVERKLQIHESHRDEFDDESLMPGDNEFEDENGDWGEEEEEEAEVNEIHFFQPAFFSEAALQLKYRVQRRRQTKAGIAWVGAFTGRDIVVGHTFFPKMLAHPDIA